MKPKLFAAIAAGSMLLLIGCSAVPDSPKKADITVQQEAENVYESTAKEVAKEFESGSQKEAQAQSEVTSGRTEILNTIDVQISREKISLDYDTVDAGPVSLDIHNGSNQPLDVVLLKTDLPADQIPTKSGHIDVTNAAVKPVAHLVTSPMPAGGDETLVRTLEPGQYVLFAYEPGKIAAAITQTITIQTAGA